MPTIDITGGYGAAYTGTIKPLTEWQAKKFSNALALVEDNLKKNIINEWRYSGWLNTKSPEDQPLDAWQNMMRLFARALPKKFLQSDITQDVIDFHEGYHEDSAVLLRVLPGASGWDYRATRNYYTKKIDQELVVPYYLKEKVCDAQSALEQLAQSIKGELKENLDIDVESKQFVSLVSVLSMLPPFEGEEEGHRGASTQNRVTLHKPHQALMNAAVDNLERQVVEWRDITKSSFGEFIFEAGNSVMARLSGRNRLQKRFAKAFNKAFENPEITECKLLNDRQALVQLKNGPHGLG